MAKTEFGQLSHYWGGNPQTLVGRWVSRKYNGFSVLWDGGATRGMLASEVPWYYKGGDKDLVVSTGLWSLGRNNKPKVVRAPKLWLDKLPLAMPLHGELWNNDDLESVKSIARRHNAGYGEWRKLQLLVFGSKPYQLWEGIEKLLKSADDKLPTQLQSLEHLRSMGYEFKDVMNDEERTKEPIRLVAQSKLNSIGQVMDWFSAFEETHWEGLMFTDLDKPYECQRSYNCLKYKPKYETEAKVVGYTDGKTGKNVGKCGGIDVEFTWDSKITSIHGGKEDFIGKKIHLTISGLNDEEREWSVIKTKYPIGSELNFTFLNVSTGGVPQSSMINREVME